MQTEIVIATYNKPELALVLEGLADQTDPDFSVVVADDGSGPETASIVERYQQRLPNLRHVWQEDRQFRKPRILNTAVRTSKADYLIFIDSDCIPEKKFVRDHKTFAHTGRFVAGRRVHIGPLLSQQLVSGEESISILHSRARLLAYAAAGRIRGFRYAMRLPWFLVNLSRYKRRGIKGCNMAMWRSDLLRINGFDSAMTGWSGAEDTDVQWRLEATGCHKAAMLGRGCVFHLHHPTTDSDPGTRQRIRERQLKNEFRVADGIETHENAQTQAP